MTHKQRMLAVMRGERVDVIPFAPRLDLWWLSNKLGGTLPERFADMTPDEIARAEGWACYHMVPDFTNMMRGPEDILHRALGLFNFKQSVYGWKFSPDIEIEVEEAEGQQIIRYHTPEGSIRTAGGLTEEMKRAGASLGWTQQHALQSPADCRALGYVFENIEVFPNYRGAQEYVDEIGEGGVVAAGGPSLGASPMHHIQKEFLDPTQFFFEYEDHYDALRDLADRVEVYFDKVLAVIEDSPAEVVLWGANYDDMLTYPPYFEKEILPWLRKASARLEARGKIMATHTDGENRGLMDLIADCGAHVAESITPHPMTRVRVEEYYRRWAPRMTLMGCIPECVTLRETASDAEFEGFLDDLFRAIAPGDRIILGIADSTPPHAVFERLQRIGERIEKEGRLPLQAGGANPVGERQMAAAAARCSGGGARDRDYQRIQRDLLAGDTEALRADVAELLDRGLEASAIMKRGMIAAMEELGEQFKAGEIFIPEMLLAARAMNAGVELLEPHLRSGDRERGAKVLIGSVRGDLHDIGKNVVSTMLRGVGFEVLDLGANVATEEFVGQVERFQPQILALSALLTTTMPEMKAIIAALEEAGLRAGLKVLVGGAPLNQSFADAIGADAYAPDAGEAVEVARGLAG